ncbi:unnamed protein product (macronuclear) [Paramecium tetraurelia]|uniref:AMP-dependent synthetase/ligase domain-containing protein n=1 Tax=Paramecium tetraurelia TaxID=5888 RepID=A0D640_PARTE|nr:uncharacterized protein GSPATT00013937001 [Paramecium tetraurelia]CAK78507.1 unnamed protein product [Paramecium tetraurelia]|eukprot:XP_001445904.1 hypothetical protein (macronuclear) [Paramecium tetraurelia strain d4-2]
MQISEKGFYRILNSYDQNDPRKHVDWTTDFTHELPIRGTKDPIPITIPQAFKQDCVKFLDMPALSVKRNKIWQTLSYGAYYSAVLDFASALIELNITELSAVNIIGFNAPEWNIAFMGSIHAHNLPVGIYTTNNPEACLYVSEHSECELLVADTREQLQKYLSIWDRLPKLKAVVLYNDNLDHIKNIPPYRKVYSWNDFLEIGKKSNNLKVVDQRTSKLEPGNCCTLIYTSGTTGNPKGVMLSHDNYMFIVAQHLKKYKIDDGYRIVSYLPLSHVAAQLVDLIGLFRWGGHLYFANPDALQGSLINTLKEVRPTFFLGVPRVWEKIYEEMQKVAKSNGVIKTLIATWAKSLGKSGTFAQTHELQPPTCFNLAETMVYQQVKKALGLDKAAYLLFGAAPLNPKIREYFLSLNMFLINAYGMSECGGVQTLSFPENFSQFDSFFMSSAGQAIEGTQMKIFQQDKDGNGEICYKGRHIFMGYFKDDDSTRQAIDEDGFLHSGDIGKIDQKGNLIITGRIKELIITAGGENVAPILIENEIKKNLEFVSNCMVIGDNRRYLSVLLTLKQDQTAKGKLSAEVISEFQAQGSQATTVEEAKLDPNVKKHIQSLIDQANQYVISKAQQIRKWTIIEGDFSVETGELTPTLKLKRKVVEKKWKGEIERMYLDSRL